MAIYISENGDWGDCDSLTFLQTDDWNESDLDCLRCWSWSVLMQFVNDVTSDGGDFEGMSPTQWEEARD